VFSGVINQIGCIWLVEDSGMEESDGHCGTHRGSTIAEAVSQSMMHTSVLEREELRIFEELLSRFDSLTNAQMNAVGVTPEWSAKDLLAHLGYWERAAAEEVREFEAGRSSAKKRTREQIKRINREVVSANRATPRHLLREELILARSEIVAAMKRAPEELEERSPLARIVYSQCVRHRGHHLEQLHAWIARLGKSS
jgi:Mycothiol maleylpyruvate isomerase N-terminal domain